MANLKTDYKDDILDSTQNTRRKFKMITNDDGTFSFEDVTDYLQYGDSFGALDLNAITNAIMNECLKRTDAVDNLESTETKLPLSANMGRELNEKIVKNYVNISVAPEYGDVVSINIARIINNTLYVDAFINITKEIPNNVSVFGFDDGNQEIVFNRRCDASLTGVKYESNNAIAITRMLAFVPGVSNYFIANGFSIPIGVYHFKIIIDLD